MVGELQRSTSENTVILLINNMMYLQFLKFLAVPNDIAFFFFFIQGCSCKNYLQPLNKENIKFLLKNCCFAEEKLRPGSTKQFSK